MSTSASDLVRERSAAAIPRQVPPLVAGALGLAVAGPLVG